MARVDMKVRGYDEFRALAQDLKRAGERDLQVELIKGMRRATKPLPALFKQSAAESLPKGGGRGVRHHRVVGRNLGVAQLVPAHLETQIGKRATRSTGVRGPVTSLATWTAGGMKVQTKVRLTGRNIGVRIVVSRPKPGGGVGNLAALNRGKARHPTFGHKPLVFQSVRGGFLTRVFDGPATFQARQECLAAVTKIRDMLASGRTGAA